jgi:hypothetical protein
MFMSSSTGIISIFGNDCIFSFSFHFSLYFTFLYFNFMASRTHRPTAQETESTTKERAKAGAERNVSVV